MLKIFLVLMIQMVMSMANATILWVGGEDFDFPNGGTVCSSTDAARFRSSFARRGYYPCSYGSVIKTNTFAGGAVTSAWVSAQWYGRDSTNLPFFGLVNSSTGQGIFVGRGPTTNQLGLFKWTGGTSFTSFSGGISGAISTGWALNKIDMHITNYGVTSTIKVYVNGNTTPAVDFTGDSSVGTTTDFNQFGFYGYSDFAISEVIVSTTDTRLMSVKTHAPNAAGTTNDWAGAYTDIDEEVTLDTDYVSETTSGQNFQCNITDLSATDYSVEAVKVAARASSTGGAVSSLAAGVYTNSTVSVPTAVNVTGGWKLVEQIYQVNPVTTTPWSVADVNSLQINLQSAP